MLVVGLTSGKYFISDGGYLENNSGLNRQPVQTMQELTS